MHFGISWKSLGGIFGHLGALLEAHRGLLEGLGSSLGSLGMLLGELFGDPERFLRDFWRSRKHLGATLLIFRNLSFYLGGSIDFEVPGGQFGTSWAPK